MNTILSHLTRCFIAGIVALLPIGGLVLTIVFLETELAAAVKDQPWYVPGMGIAAAAVIIYIVGLFVTTFIGKWLFNLADAILNNLPILGKLYQTLKQLLGYGEGEDAMFKSVVLVESRENNAQEIGLVTDERTGADGQKRLVVFIPGAPMPTAGRLLVIEDTLAKTLPISPHDAMKALVSVGMTDMGLEKIGLGQTTITPDQLNALNDPQKPASSD